MTYLPRMRVLRGDEHPASSMESNRKLARDFEVVANVHDNQTLMRAARDLKPDVVVMDVATSARDGFKVAKEIIRSLPQTKVIFKTSKHTCRSCAERGLVTAIHSCGFGPRRARGLANAGHFPMKAAPLAPPACDGEAELNITPELLNPSAAKDLTPREFEVLALLACGASMKGIAHQLGITYRTVTFHKYRMMKRLGIKTNAGIMHYAIRRDVADAYRRPAERAACA